jgi:glycosyltransferase involved in cell wall biosynthesis
MPEKGILECVELADEHGIALKVVGEDEFVEDHGYVLEVIDRCRRSNHADYVGKVDADRKTDLLGDARGLVLLPRHPYREAFGLAAVEAMAAGTPVIATDNTGLGEVVRTVQGTGAYDDLDRVGEAMCDLAGGDGGFPGPEALRTGVEEHFSKAAMADAYLDRIDEAVAEGW